MTIRYVYPIHHADARTDIAPCGRCGGRPAPFIGGITCEGCGLTIHIDRKARAQLIEEWEAATGPDGTRHEPTCEVAVVTAEAWRECEAAIDGAWDGEGRYRISFPGGEGVTARCDGPYGLAYEVAAAWCRTHADGRRAPQVARVDGGEA